MATTETDIAEMTANSAEDSNIHSQDGVSEDGVSEDGVSEEGGYEAEGVELEEAEPLSLSAELGSLLFVSTRPLTVEHLAQLSRSTEEEVDDALKELQSQLDVSTLGFSLYEVGGAWQLRTGPKNARVVQRLIPPRARRLSRAAAESLAVIAYKQPIQRSEIEAIRGVDALPTLRTLLDARLVRIVGREASPGQPALYGTTSVFLEKFGLNDLADLPAIRELMELAAEPGEIGESNESEDEEREASVSEDGPFETSAAEPLEAGEGIVLRDGEAGRDGEEGDFQTFDEEE